MRYGFDWETALYDSFDPSLAAFLTERIIRGIAEVEDSHVRNIVVAEQNVVDQEIKYDTLEKNVTEDGSDSWFKQLVSFKGRKFKIGFSYRA